MSLGVSTSHLLDVGACILWHAVFVCRTALCMQLVLGLSFPRDEVNVDNWFGGDVLLCVVYMRFHQP
jgi:hypothetical protein